jgi:hypothetical protein
MQAHEKPADAAREVRALLDLMRDHDAAVKKKLRACVTILRHVVNQVSSLKPGGKEVSRIRAMAVALGGLHPVKASDV